MKSMSSIFLNASLLAMKRAVEALPVRPDHVLVDGNKLPTWDYSAEAVVGGDGTVPAIALRRYWRR